MKTHFVITYLLGNIISSNKIVLPLEILGPDHFDFAYYDYFNEEDLIVKFDMTTFPLYYSFSSTPTFDKVGTKDYILYVSNDKFDDDFQFEINIYDDISPVILGPDYFYFDPLKKIELETYLRFYQGFDDLEGYLDVYIEESNIDISLGKKQYDFTIYSCDSSKNKVTKKVILYPNETYETVYISNKIELSINIGEIKTLNELIDALIDKHYIDDLNYKFTYKTYFDENNFFMIGKYNIEIKLNYENKEYDLLLVLDVKNDMNKHISLMRKIINFFIDLFKRIRL